MAAALKYKYTMKYFQETQAKRQRPSVMDEGYSHTVFSLQLAASPYKWFQLWFDPSESNPFHRHPDRLCTYRVVYQRVVCIDVVAVLYQGLSCATNLSSAEPVDKAGTFRLFMAERCLGH